MKKVLEKPKRKAIFVDPEVFEQFRIAARADGRKYSAFLRKLLAQ